MLACCKESRIDRAAAGQKEGPAVKILAACMLCLFPLSCRSGEPEVRPADKVATATESNEKDSMDAAGGQVWLPGKASITRGDETYFLDVTPDDMEVFIRKNKLKPLAQWPQLATTGYRGYNPPEQIKKLHPSDPLMSGTSATSIPTPDGYTAVYYNSDFHYLVIQE
jgi:hypothetical protein